MSTLKAHYRMDAPVDETRIDRSMNSVIGKPQDRYEGPLKVTGQAAYAYETARNRKDALYGYFVLSTRGKARIIRLDSRAAEAMPGVRHVVRDARAVRGSADPSDNKPALIEDEVVHYGQAVTTACP